MIAAEQETEAIRALRSGDEAAFGQLVERYHAGMVRFAARYVPESDMAEEVAQEAWLAVLRGLDRFEARSSLRTWIYGIVANLARSRATRERRSLPYSSLEDRRSAPSVEPERFFPADHPRWPGWWDEHPRSWEDVPEERLLAAETRSVVEGVIADLPPYQRLVITLRDLQGWTAAEARSVLRITDTNQRVLLHRARSRVRRTLEKYFDEEF